MAKSRREDKPNSTKPEGSRRRRREPPAPPARGWVPTAAGIRETVEIGVTVLIFALLLRAFDVEAFVVPTGSMAPTLMGRHKDVQCPQCKYPYQVGASEEMSESGEPTGNRTIAGTCPLCRFTADLSPNNTLDRDYPSYNGDRLLVGKFSYHVRDPERWDIAVFRYPLNAPVNYIKRLVGLPNETLRIQYGDLWVKPDGADAFVVARKPPRKILAMMQPVYDNDYTVPALVQKGLPMRWAPVEADRQPGAWTTAQDLKSFHTDGTAPEEVWLGYRHLVPSYEDWAHLVGAAPAPPERPKPQLISDMTAYDTHQVWPSGDSVGAPPALPRGLGPLPTPWLLGVNWVGDLVLECELDVAAPSGDILMDLVQGGRHFLCRLDVAQGTVELSIRGVQGFRATSSSGMRGPGKHSVRSANVDRQLLLWLDGRLVAFDGPTTYDAAVDTTVPGADDLIPVRIGSRGAAVRASHLRIFRDIYYVAQKVRHRDERVDIYSDLEPSVAGSLLDYAAPERAAQFLSSPAEWSVFGSRRSVEFKLQKDQYFMLGDNSTGSKDSRLWDPTLYYVRRDLLIGGAIFVYWPHSWDRIPGTGIWLPMFPNFARMRLVR